MKKVLITGGAGFIGSHLVDTMVESGYTVTVLDCLLEQVHGGIPTNDKDGWPDYLNKNVRRIKANILDGDVFEEALADQDYLIHLAASVGVGQSMTNIVDYTQNNTMVAAKMLEVLSKKKHNIKRIAVASSMSIYGEGEYLSYATQKPVLPKPRTIEQLKNKSWEVGDGAGNPYTPIPTKESHPLNPASIYAINKQDHEQMFICVGRALGIPTVALRLFNAYGSRQALSNPYTGVAELIDWVKNSNQKPIDKTDIMLKELSAAKLVI